MLNLGRVCVKTAGRDANLKCVIIEEIDENFVMIDGLTRRKRCNKLHLEPTKDTLDVKKGASHEEVVKAFKSDLNIEIPKKGEAKTAQATKPAKAKKGHDKMLLNQKEAAKEDKPEKKTKPAPKKAVKKEKAAEAGEEAAKEAKPKKTRAKKEKTE